MLFNGSKVCSSVTKKFWNRCMYHCLRSFLNDQNPIQGFISPLCDGVLAKTPNYRLTSSTFFTVPGISNKKKEYNARKIVGFSMDQMYSVVSDVENYTKFVPFCSKSLVHSRTGTELFGELEIGFPPVMESYTSKVSLSRPRLVKAVCTDGRLFHHLVTAWSFNPGLKNEPNSCLIHFYVSFEFKSLLHSQLAHMFFNELVRQMESAFFREAERRFGQPTISTMKIKTKL